LSIRGSSISVKPTWAKQMCLAQHGIQTIILLAMMLDKTGLNKKRKEEKGDIGIPIIISVQKSAVLGAAKMMCRILKLPGLW